MQCSSNTSVATVINLYACVTWIKAAKLARADRHGNEGGHF